MAVRVGRWDCPTCGHIGNTGPQTKCSACSAPRPKDVVFYLPQDAEIVIDEHKLKEAGSGVDWICGHCTAQNKATQTECWSCANPRDETSQDVNLEEREYSNEEVPIEGQKRQRTIHPLEQQRLVSPKRGGWFKKILIAGLVLLGGVILLRSFPKQISVTVEEFTWERTTQMLHYEPVTKEEWSVPQGAYDVSSFQAIKEYKQVLRGYETRTRDVQVKVGEETYVCGQIDRGNGYFEDKYCTRPIYETRTETYEEAVYDQVPVYATKYRFTIMEWVAHKENLLYAGGKDHNPQWPSTEGKTNPEQWKEGDKTQVYKIVVVEDDGDKHTEEVGLEFWSKLEEGGKIKAKRSFLFDIYYGLDEPTKDR
ncbi:MAG: zinc finger protein [Bacteroidia bacterium]|nr:zinc finger protein [Bacteroidia bacterium]